MLSGVFLPTFDFSIVSVAIPAIQAGLGASHAEVQFVVAGNGLAYAVMLITGGRLGDLVGRKRFVQHGVGLSSEATGLMFCPYAIAFLGLSLSSARMGKALGPNILRLGMALMAAGLGGLIVSARSAPAESQVAALLASLIVYGAGQGLAQSPLIGFTLAEVAPAESGAASGLVSTLQQVAQALGVAAIGSFFYAHLGGAPAPGDWVHALSLTLLLNIALLAGGGLFSLGLRAAAR